MNRLTFLAIAAVGLVAAGCDDPAPVQVETAPPPMVEAPPVEPAPEVAPPAPETPPVDSTALPPDERDSQKTVEPESETLFY